MRRSRIKKIISGLGLGFALFISGLLWAFGSQSLGPVSLLSVSPRIITPNGDSLNDVVFFQFDGDLSGLPLSSGVYDINGAKVTELSLVLNNTALSWDGRDESGRYVTSGAYVYAIQIGNKTVNGTVVIAK
jgi:flagellar hook assembly protein FlgD